MKHLTGPTQSIRFVGGHYDAPDLFDFECQLIRQLPNEVVVATGDPPGRQITIRSRYIGKSIDSVSSERTTQICTYEFDDGSHSGMALWAEADDGTVTITAHDY